MTSLAGQDDLDRPAPARSIKLGGDVEVPYPEPTSATATRVGRANRRNDTSPEVHLRSALHRLGLRFRKDHRTRCEQLSVRPDAVFTRRRVAVFVDGCFWHGRPTHRRIPRSNREYWVPKLQRHVERDRLVDEALREYGCLVIRVREHDDPVPAAERTADLVRDRGVKL